MSHLKSNKRIYIIAVIFSVCYFLAQNPEYLSFLEDGVQQTVNGVLHLVTAVSAGLGFKEIFEKVLSDYKKEMLQDVKPAPKKKVARKRVKKKTVKPIKKNEMD